MKYLFLSLLFVFAMAVSTMAQVSRNESPVSFSLNLPNEIDRVELPEIDIEALFNEDAATSSKHIPPRFGYPFPVDLGLENAGTWIVLADGSRLWRLEIISTGAYSINIANFIESI